MEFLNFVHENFYILAVVLYAIGMFVKTVPEQYIPNWTIPFVLWVTGIALAFGMGGVNIDAFIQGTLTAALAVFGDNVLKQLKSVKGV